MSDLEVYLGKSNVLVPLKMNTIFKGALMQI